MPKIIVLGNSGSGKSTLATKLSTLLGIDCLHLDTIVYKYDWKQPDFVELEKQVNEMCLKQDWIMDGNFLDNAKQRFEECDTIYFLDMNRLTCLRSVIKRYKKYKGKHRESKSDYCEERLTKDFLKWVYFDFYKTSRKTILKYLKEVENKKVYIFKNRRQVKKYLAEVNK